MLSGSDCNPLVKIRWLGHASFLVTAQDGTRWLSDPYEDSIGYLMPRLQADFVTISHHHFDHSSLQALTHDPPIFDTRGHFRYHRYSLFSVRTFHDAQGGARWGENLVFVVDFDGFRLGHLGDLGHRLTHYQRAEIGRLDVIMIPVGGAYTLDAAGASEVVRQLDPHIVIPMHYRGGELAFPLDRVEQFMCRWPRAVMHAGSTLEVIPSMLEERQQVHVLRHS